MKIKIGLLIAFACLLATSWAADEAMIKNVLENIPYRDDGMGRRELVNTPHLLMMQAALKPGQAVPHHKANSNVHLLILKGEVVITLDGKDTVAKEGAPVPVAFQTPMSVTNKSKENASFLIIKTPNPSQMAGKGPS